MTTHRRAALAVCAAAFAVLNSLPVAAQDTTRMRDSTRRTTTPTSTPAARRATATSDMRVRVQKDNMSGESHGRLDVTKADSIAAAQQAARDSVAREMQRTRDSIAAVERARADSVARVEKMRADSIASVAAAAAAAIEAARRDSVARADSIANAEQMRQQRIRDSYRFHNSGWYVGVSGGGNVPTGDFESLGYRSGYGVNVPIGWHKPNSLLGFRVDLGYSQFSGRNFLGNGPDGVVTLTNGSPKVLSASLNLTARLPLNASKTLALYGVGGGGLFHFRDFGGASALGGFLGNDVLTTNESALKKTRNKLGAQVGGGFDFGVGPASIFVESRFVSVFADRDDNVQFRDFFGENRSKTLKWVPIVIGVNLR